MGTARASILGLSLLTLTTLAVAACTTATDDAEDPASVSGPTDDGEGEAEGATEDPLSAPPATGPLEFTDAAVYQRESVARWSAEVTRLAGAIEGWSESALDRYRLPHPLLGKLTVREMLLFTFYHHEHHANTVKRRLAGLPVV